MEQPSDWTPPPYKRRSKTKLQPNDKPEWRNFSYWFNRRFLDHTQPESEDNKTTGLHPPAQIQTNLSYCKLAEDRFKECKTSPKTVEESAAALPLADGNTPTSWCSTEGKVLAYYFPRALSHVKPYNAEEPAKPEDDLLHIGFTSINQLVQASKPNTQKKDAKRYGEEVVQMNRKEWEHYRLSMVAKLGAWGRYIFGLWHATGQTKRDPTMTAEEAGTATRAMAVQQWYPAFAPVFQAIGRIFQEADPWAYHYYRSNYDYWQRKFEFVKTHYVSARCCFMSTAILINQNVLPHRDGVDMVNGWVAMTVFGSFTGGYLCLPDLNIKVPYQPGDVILFRSALLEHYITQFEGTRYSVVFFTKESVVPDGGPLQFNEQAAVQQQPLRNKTEQNRRKRLARKRKQARREAARLEEEIDAIL